MKYFRESLIVIFMTLDYVLTYIGIQANMIVEGNPILVDFMELEFSRGITLRLLSIFMLIVIFQLLKREEHYFRFVTSFAIFANLSVLYLHCIWLFHGWLFNYGIFG